MLFVIMFSTVARNDDLASRESNEFCICDVVCTIQGINRARMKHWLQFRPRFYTCKNTKCFLLKQMHIDCINISRRVEMKERSPVALSNRTPLSQKLAITRHLEAFYTRDESVQA